jgi:hypothetical protein
MSTLRGDDGMNTQWWGGVDGIFLCLTDRGATAGLQPDSRINCMYNMPNTLAICNTKS